NYYKIGSIENNLCKARRKHSVSHTHVYMETLENSTKPSKEPEKARCT
ncbi:hypothetical protein HMPREF9467_04322, partial [, partial [[Clostridium] clostridioforme 2_1_49FAA]